MVCVPCFIVPVLLFIWHRFILPIVLRYWNPWERKDEAGNVVKTEFPFKCIGNQCKFVPKNQTAEENPNDTPDNEIEITLKKSDAESKEIITTENIIDNKKLN